jgi:hypothetical protein
MGSCGQETNLREVALLASRKWYGLNVMGDIVCRFMFAGDKKGGGCACPDPFRARTTNAAVSPQAQVHPYSLRQI